MKTTNALYEETIKEWVLKSILSGESDSSIIEWYNMTPSRLSSIKNSIIIDHCRKDSEKLKGYESKFVIVDELVDNKEKRKEYDPNFSVLDNLINDMIAYKKREKNMEINEPKETNNFINLGNDKYKIGDKVAVTVHINRIFVVLCGFINYISSESFGLCKNKDLEASDEDDYIDYDDVFSIERME